MSFFISDKDKAKLYARFQLDPNNRESKSWCKNELIYTSGSEILKPFKKLAVVYYQV